MVKTSRTRNAALLVALGLAVSVLASSCGSDEQFVSMEVEERFVVENIEQLVAYSDYVVVFSVTSERRIAPADRPPAPQAYRIQRDVTATIDRVLWSSAAAPDMAETVTFRNGGWWVKDGQGAGVRVESGGNAILVGQTFVAGFVGDGSAAFPLALGLTSTSATFALDGDRAVTDSPFELAAISEMNLDELAAELQRVGSLPEIRAFEDLDLTERSRAKAPGR